MYVCSVLFNNFVRFLFLFSFYQIHDFLYIIFRKLIHFYKVFTITKWFLSSLWWFLLMTRWCDCILFGNYQILQKSKKNTTLNKIKNFHECWKTAVIILYLYCFLSVLCKTEVFSIGVLVLQIQQENSNFFK